MAFHTVVQDIKSLRIQGAEAVAREGVRSLLLVLKESRSVTKEALIAELFFAKKELTAARPTEPCLRNALEYVFANIYSYTDDHNFCTGISQRIEEVLHFFENASKRIVRFSAAKIRHHSIVYTHCHSSTVVSILKEAKKQGKKFTVHNTETRHLYQGRKTAAELATAGIPVRHFVDSAAGVAIKDAHLCFFGCDAITSYAVYNKIGSGIFAELLHARKIPLHICTNSWKFDPTETMKHKEIIEQRNPEEVWHGAPRKIVVEDPAFEPIIMPHITSIISELGVLTPATFLRQVRKTHPWMK